MENRKPNSKSKIFSNALAAALVIIFLGYLFLTINHQSRGDIVAGKKCMFEISALATGIESYKAKYQKYPSSIATQLWKELSGKNPSKIVFVSFSVGRLTTNGEYLDSWGSPITIHFYSTNDYEIFSVGKDKVSGSKDDIIFNSASNAFVNP